MLALWALLWLAASAEELEAELVARSAKLEVAFEPGSDVLQPGGIAALEPWVALLAKAEVVVEISGHTDSSGDAGQNLALSQRRADAVRRWLLERGVAPDRLVARGVGDRQPRASNATPKGRALNRRIELHVEGRRPALPADPNAPARFTYVKPAVERRAAGATTFSLAALGDRLFPRDQVDTREEAAAEITFPDASYVLLLGNAHITLGSVEPKRGAAARSLELTRGTGELTFTTDAELGTPAARVAARARELVLDVDAQQMSRVSVHVGEADVSARGARVKVPEGHGTRAALGRPPEKARPLPGRVRFSEPQRRARLHGSASGPLVFSWEPAPRAVRYRFELATDARFNARVVSTQTEQTRFEAPALEPGQYFARVVSLDADGLSSRPSVAAEVAVVLARRRVPRGEPLELELPEGTLAVLDGEPVPPPQGASRVTRVALSAGRHVLGVRADPTEPFDEVSLVALGAAPDVTFDDARRTLRLSFPPGERPAAPQLELWGPRGPRPLVLTAVGDDAYEAELEDTLEGTLLVGGEPVAELSHRIAPAAPLLAQSGPAPGASVKARPEPPVRFPRPDVPSHAPGQLEAAGELENRPSELQIAAFVRTTVKDVASAGARVRAGLRVNERVHLMGLLTLERGRAEQTDGDVGARLTCALAESSELSADAPVRLSAVLDGGARLASSVQRPSGMLALGVVGSLASGRLRLSTSHQLVVGLGDAALGAYRLNGLLAAVVDGGLEVHLGLDGNKPLAEGAPFEWALSLGASGPIAGGLTWSLALYSGLAGPGAERYGLLSALGSLGWEL